MKTIMVRKPGSVRLTSALAAFYGGSACPGDPLPVPCPQPPPPQ